MVKFLTYYNTLFLGTTSNENDAFPPYTDLQKWNWTTYEESVWKSMSTFSNLTYQTAMRLYPSHYKTPEYQYTSMSSDLRVSCPNDVLALYAASTFTSPVYRYVATYSPSQPVEAGGMKFSSKYAFHTWDVYTFFGFLSDLIKRPTADDLWWQRNIQDEVLSFVRHGYPKTTTWLPYPEKTANLSVTTRPLNAYNPVQCQFWLQNGFFSYAWIN